MLPVAVAAGGGSAALPLPAAPGLTGYFQALLADPAQPQGLALTNGLKATICP